MDYGNVTTPISLMECDWVRHGVGDMGEPTYKRDEASFLLVNFLCILTTFSRPLCSPILSATNILLQHTWPWCVVLHYKPRSVRSQVSNYQEFINTRVCVMTLEAEAMLPHIKHPKHSGGYNIV